jgi:DNA-binding transcriptional regulator YdaS (Cro superfamily)
MKENKALLKIVKKVGSVTNLANTLGCNKANVSRWANGVHKIPIKYIKKLVELSKGEVKKKDLRPDVYDD